MGFGTAAKSLTNLAQNLRAISVEVAPPPPPPPPPWLEAKARALHIAA
jgi:hypothetical protein